MVFLPKRRRRIFILSYGMGVESHAILERWINEPETRPFDDWADLIIVVAQVGEENRADTIPNVERRTLPLLRKLGVRFVELARRGASQADGVVVLQDTRSPERLHPDGVYRLSDELLSAGVVPHAAGEHRCAIKHKCWPVTKWVNTCLLRMGDAPIFDHSGALIQPAVVDADSGNPIEPPVVIFGYNVEEQGRIDRCKEYDDSQRVSAFPLQEWGWNRQDCWNYIFERSGIDWKKSHCSFCPFCAEAAKGQAGAIERWLAAPDQTAHGLVVEYNSMCFNPRGHLFANGSLIAVVRRHCVTAVLEAFERGLSSLRWGFYRVRRIYSAKGKAVRAVDRLAEGSRETMEEMFDVKKADESLPFETIGDIRYAFFQRREDGVYPTAEGFYVVAPLFVETKVRGTMERFDERWTSVLSLPSSSAAGEIQTELPMPEAA